MGPVARSSGETGGGSFACADTATTCSFFHRSSAQSLRATTASLTLLEHQTQFHQLSNCPA
eukprot:2591295-Rhodomonas_salina.2